MPRITTNDGVRLHYTDQGAGPPVVLIAGFRAAATSWVYQQEFLVRSGFRVLSLDRRSHGLSEDPAYGHRMARHGKDLHDFLTAIELEEPDGCALVGGSMGASTIWACIDLFGTHGIRGVVSVDQTVKMCNEDGWDHGYYGYYAGNLGTFFSAGPPLDTGHGTPLQERGKRLERVLTALQLDAEALAPGPLPATALALLRDHAVQDWRDVVARLEVPALFVGARDSELWPCEHAGAAAALSSRGAAVVLEDCGHAAHMERPERFNEALASFLARL